MLLVVGKFVDVRQSTVLPDCVVQYLYRVQNTFRSWVILLLRLLCSWTQTLHHQLPWKRGPFPSRLPVGKTTSPRTRKCQGWRRWRLCWRGRQRHPTLVMLKIWRLFLGQVVPRRGKGMLVICSPRIRCFLGSFVTFLPTQIFGTTVDNASVYVMKWYVFHINVLVDLFVRILLLLLCVGA